MLLSFIIQLKPKEPCHISAWQGRALYSIFLEQWIQAFDQTLATSIHDDQGLKPFCVSNLFSRSNHSNGAIYLKPDQSAWFRVTTFSPELSKLVKEKLMSALQNKQPELCELKIGSIPFDVAEGAALPAEKYWQGESSYPELAQGRLLGARCPDSFSLEFTSPTAIKSKNKHINFPIPDQLVGHWLEKWNRFAPLSLPDEIRKYAEECVAVSRYRLETSVAYYGDATYIGFTGRCTWRILEKDPYWARMLYHLASFAFYCGTGHHTTIGLGQTRIYEKLDRPHSG